MALPDGGRVSGGRQAQRWHNAAVPSRAAGPALSLCGGYGTCGGTMLGLPGSLKINSKPTGPAPSGRATPMGHGCVSAGVRRVPDGLARAPGALWEWFFRHQSGRRVSLSFRLCWFRPESSCRGGALAGSRMIVESPTGMPSEDSTKAGLPIRLAPAADRFAVNARFVAAGSGAVLRCERRLPGFTTFASPKYPSPKVKLTRHPKAPPVVHGRDGGLPWMSGVRKCREWRGLRPGTGVCQSRV